MARKSFAEVKALEAAGTHRLVAVSVGRDAYTHEWCVWERDRDGRPLYRAVFATEGEATVHGRRRLVGEG